MDKKIDENQLAEMLYSDILKSLKVLGKSLYDDFKYDTVVLEENLIENFSYEKLFGLINLKIRGVFRYERAPMGISLRMDFNKNNT